MYAGILELEDRPLTRMAVALGLIAVAWVVGRGLRAVLTPRFTKTRTPSFGRVVPKIVAWSILTVATVAAVTIAFPSVKPVDIISGLGIFSIAVGFAFQDILSNLLAGLLLILRQPFESGDQIEVNGFTGTVDVITIRETRITTFAGEQVVIPNKDVYQSALIVKTANPNRRTSVIVGVGYGDDLDEAERILLDVLSAIEGVASDPEPQAYLVALNDSTVDFDLRYWTGSEQATVRRVQHEVVKRVKVALDEAGIDMPFPVQTIELGGSATDAVASVRSRSSDPDPAVVLEDRSKEELYELARALDVPGRSGMTRAELVDGVAGSLAEQ